MLIFQNIFFKGIYYLKLSPILLCVALAFWRSSKAACRDFQLNFSGKNINSNFNLWDKTIIYGVKKCEIKIASFLEQKNQHYFYTWLYFFIISMVNL